MTYNKIHSLSFCLCRPPNHYCTADNAAAAPATQRWDGWLSNHQAAQTHTHTHRLSGTVCVCLLTVCYSKPPALPDPDVWALAPLLLCTLMNAGVCVRCLLLLCTSICSLDSYAFLSHTHTHTFCSELQRVSLKQKTGFSHIMNTGR